MKKAIMKNFWIPLFTLLVAFGTKVQAQQIITFAKITDFRWKASYFGESLIHPGLQLGVEQRLTSWDKRKEAKKLSPLATIQEDDSPEAVCSYLILLQ